MKNLFNSSVWKQKSPLWLASLGIAGLILFMGYMSQYSQDTHPIAKMTPEERQNRQHLYEIVQRSGGDYSKINPVDKKWLLKMAGRDEFAHYAYDDVKGNPHPSWW